MDNTVSTYCSLTVSSENLLASDFKLWTSACITELSLVKACILTSTTSDGFCIISKQQIKN